MDPLAHTLVGAAMAETGLKKASRYATVTLLIGVNLPDIDALATFWGSDVSLYVRRGWSHGVLSLVLLPLVLAGAVWAWHRWRGHRKLNAPPFRLGMIVLLSYMAVWSHPLLDWMNTYGVRLLMPFDDRWFYGDTLFIVDPWLWLLAAAGVVLARSTGYSAVACWGLLAALTSGVVLLTDVAPLGVKVLWALGVAAIVLLRWRKPSASLQLGISQASFALLLAYVCMAYGLARVAESVAAAGHPGPSSEPVEVQANPMPGNPAAHRVVLVYERAYRVVLADGEIIDIPREPPGPVVQQALADDSIRGFVTWMRYPYWEVEELEQSWQVTLMDLRYVVPGGPQTGIGQVQVVVPKGEVRPATNGKPLAPNGRPVR